MWVNVLRANASGGFRFKSFAPIHSNVNAKWFIDGKEYFDALIPCIQKARTRILIADWFLSEELYLERKVPLNSEKRLDNLLKAAANRVLHNKFFLFSF